MTLKQTYRFIKSIPLLLIAGILLAATLSSFTKVYGLNPLTSIWAIETNMDATSNSQLWVAFKTPATESGSPGTISIALSGTGVGVGANNTALGTTSTGCTGATGAFNFLNGGSGATALPGSPTATGTSGTISITGVTALTPSAYYCVVFGGSSAVTNPTSAGVYSYTISDNQDTGTEYLSILGSGTNEAISLTNVTVPQSFTLTLGGTTDSFTGNLSTSSVTSTTGVNATVSSNAASGVGLFAYDSNTGLHSTSTGHTISSTSPNNTSAQTITTSAEGYITNAVYQSNTGGATLTVATPFNGTGATGDGLSPTPSEIAYNSAPTSFAIVKIKENATVTALTPSAGDYADTVTIVGAGSF